jgi:hypothetical protein
VKNRVCLSRDVQVAGAVWRAVMRIMTRVGGLVQRIGDGHSGRVLDGRAIERCTWPHCVGHAEFNSKMDESMRWTTSDSTTLTLLFSKY